MNTLTLVRGLPGSGKTSFAMMLPGKKISADDYFVTEGEYVFDPDKLGEAHEFCQKMTENYIKKTICDVVVHNTFSETWEIAPYVGIAFRAGARLHVVDLFAGGLADQELCTRNSHGVPLRTIQAMRARWEHDWRAGDPRPPWERGGLCATCGGEGEIDRVGDWDECPDCWGTGDAHPEAHRSAEGPPWERG